MSTPPPIPPSSPDPSRSPDHPLPPSVPSAPQWGQGMDPSQPSPSAYNPATAASPPPDRTTRNVVIGCLVALMVVLVAVVAGAFWVGGKVKNMNPSKLAAQILVAADPQLEISASNDAEKTVTIRDKRTGEETLFTMQDIQNGKLSKYGQKQAAANPPDSPAETESTVEPVKPAAPE